MFLLYRMSKGTVDQERVMIATAFSADFDISITFQFVNDALRSSFRNSDPFSYMTKL